MTDGSAPARGAPTPAPGSAKKSSSGCLTVLVMFAAIAGLGVVVFIVALWRAFGTPEGHAYVKNFTEVAALLQDAQTAPGAEAVARRGGCVQALVLDMDKMQALSPEVSTGDGGAGRASNEHTMVTCQVGFAREPPECDALAATYVESAHPSAPFRVAVQRQGDPNRACERVFDQAGRALNATPVLGP